MTRKILVISPFFAPQSHAAVFRAHKLSKYLARRGWEVHVATVSTNYNYNEDENLLGELPKNVVLHRIPYLEPTLRGLRMRVGGKDRTFKRQKERGSESLVAASSQGLLTRTYKYLLQNYLYDPDSFWTWGNCAVDFCEDLIAKEKIQIIYTTSMPFTTLRIGKSLKDKMAIKWVADFRDPCSYNYRNVASEAKVIAHQRQIEEAAIKSADVLTGLSSCYNLIYHDMYGLPKEKRIHFIPTGVDNDYLENVQSHASEFPYFIFVGEYLKEYHDYFFRIFAESLKDQEISRTGIKLVMIGNKDINSRIVAEPIRKLGLQDRVIIMDHMPQRNVYSWIKGARAALLISGESAYWWTNFAKMTDYIAMKASVVALVPMISEARQELTRAGTGVFIESPEDLKKFLLQDNSSLQINSEYCRRYLASSMCDAFEKIFLDLIQ